MTSLAQLPDSLLLASLFMLDARSLMRVGRSCKEMRDLSRDSSLYAGRGQATLTRMQRFVLRPPSIRHLRLLFGPQSPSLVPALDLTALPSPPGATELFPAASFSRVRLLRIRDVTLWCDLQGAEYLVREVFGGGGALCPPEPRAGSTVTPASADRGLMHLIVSNPASDAFEQAQSVGFNRMASTRAFPPLPSSVPTRRTSSSASLLSVATHASSRFSGRGFGAGSGSSSSSTLSFDYTDAHLGLLCFHLASSLRSLVIPFAPSAFTSLGLIKLKFLSQLRTLAIGLREFAADLLSIPAAPADGSGLRSLSLGLRSLRSDAATIQGTRRSDAAHTQVAHRRREEAARQRRQQELEERGSFIHPIAAEDAPAPPEADLLDPSDPFVLLSTRFVGLRALALHWTHHRSAEGLNDLTSAQIALLGRMESLTQLRLAKRPQVEGHTTQHGPRGPQVYRAVDSLLRVAAASFLGSEAASSVPSTELLLQSQSSEEEFPAPSFVSRTPPHLYNLMHGSCLAPLASLALRKLALEGFALFEGTTAAWADLTHLLAGSLESLTLSGCDLRPGSASKLASLSSLVYLELSRCRLPGESFSQLMSSWPQNHPLEELIVFQCIDERGEDVCLHSEWPLETVEQPSPWAHLQRLTQLQTLFVLHADSPATYTESHVLHLQSLMVNHWAAIGSFLRSGRCQLQSLTLAHAIFSTEAAWSALYSGAGEPCRSLLSHDVSYACGLSDPILLQLASLAPRLLRLDLSYARRDESLTPVSGVASSANVASIDPLEPQSVATPSSSPVSPLDEESKANPSAADADLDSDYASVDAPLCPYSPAGLLAALGGLPDLRSLRALCSSAADAGAFMRSSWLQRCRASNPLCSIISSRYQ